MPLWDISQREGLKIAVIGRMVVEVGANVARMQHDMNKMNRHVNKFTRSAGSAFKMLGGIMGASLGVMGIIAGFKSVISETAALGDQFHKMALRTGIAEEKLSALSYAAQISGTNIEVVEKSLRYATGVMLDFSMGVGEAKKTFEALGLTVVDSSGKLKNTADFLVEVADKFKDMKDDTLMAAYAAEIFGARAGTQLLPLLRLGSKGIEELMQKAKELGVVIGKEEAARAAEYTDRMTDLKEAMGGLKRILGNELLPVLTDYAKGVTEWIKQHRELIKIKVPEYLDKIKESLTTLWNILSVVPVEVIEFGLVGLLIFGKKGMAIGAALGAIKGLLDEIDSATEMLRQKIKDAFIITEEDLFAGGEPGEISGATKMFEEIAEKSKESIKTILAGDEETVEEGLSLFKENLDLRLGYFMENQELILEGAKTEAQLRLEIAEDEARRERQIDAMRMQSKINWFQTARNVMQAYTAFAGKESKVVFAITKALQVGQATAAAFAASTMALATPPGPPYTIPLATAVLAMGLSNAAAIAALGLGTLIGGGGGGAAAAPTIAQPLAISPYPGIEEPEERGALIIIIEGDVLTEDYYIDKLAEKISKAVEDRDVRLIATHAKYAEVLT